LCYVLAERKEYYLHAFKIGLYGLEMPRLPASTKSLEVSFVINTLFKCLNKIIIYYMMILSKQKNLKINYYLGENESPRRRNIK